ncbi:hypothetical protein Taro_005287 [Colocasia esculenta]|uniref:Uncharacterized protein n=1 Tax=Colocasia esculenta TaxID=4460 RepID=A0A843TXG6_COLES|nr:hypothetical protein [Colocasia esculenta]
MIFRASSEFMTPCSGDGLGTLLLLELPLAVDLLVLLELADFRGLTMTHSLCEACNLKMGAGDNHPRTPQLVARLASPQPLLLDNPSIRIGGITERVRKFDVEGKNITLPARQELKGLQIATQLSLHMAT